MNIEQACEAFKKLLEEQQTRIANMDTTKTDFSTKEVVTIGVVDGDGIGPIITQHAARVLKKLLADEVAAGSIVIKEIQGLTIENRMAQGKAIPDDVLAEIHMVLFCWEKPPIPMLCSADSMSGETCRRCMRRRFLAARRSHPVLLMHPLPAGNCPVFCVM